MTINRRPWERRLEDLAQVLSSCAASYFNPDLFRRNVNHFLQTSRTVTFIIQKHKSEIPDFDTWYQGAVLDAWKDDIVMQWAKNSRNTIEKEGDLEFHSSLQVTLVSSYLVEQDVKLECSRAELLYATADRLLRLARDKLPVGVRDAAALRIERSWITSTLASHELLWAIGYVYARVFECVESLADRLQRKVPETISRPSDVSVLREASRQVEYIKLNNMQHFRIKTQRVHLSSHGSLPPQAVEAVGRMRNEASRPHNFESAMGYYSKMAEITFEQWGSHYPILFLLDDEWTPIDMITFVPDDQAEKYFFWRTIGERVALQAVNAVVFTSEAWLRKAEAYPQRPIRELPIIGEKLEVTGFDRGHNIGVRSWEIRRSDHGKAILGQREESYKPTDQPNFLVPVMRAMGFEPSFIRRAPRAGC